MLVSFDVQETQDKIRGPGIIVEIDESKFGKRKYNRGYHVEGVWIFGGVERTPERKMFAMAVDDRSAETLLFLIEENINPGLNFVDPITGTHTNTIEGTWNGIKIQ
ncbi:11650_t:CDS:2, partial [Ambispora leptoticha]